MKKINLQLLAIWILPILISAGCNTPNPVQLIDDQNDSKLIDMKTVVGESDSLLVSSGVDSTGILGWGNPRFFGRMIFTSTRYGLIDSLARDFNFYEAIFLDSSKSIQYSGHILAFPSFDVGTLSINSDPLNKITRRIQLPVSLIDTNIGYLYQLKTNYSYNAGVTKTWTASGSSVINPFSIHVVMPPELRITDVTPLYVSTNEPLHLKWSCTNPIVNIIISHSGMLQQRTWVAVLHLRVRNTKGEITIPTKILQLLPKRFDRFLFTLSSDNRSIQAAGTVGGYPNEILVQAASIHNILLNVRR